MATEMQCNLEPPDIMPGFWALIIRLIMHYCISVQIQQFCNLCYYCNNYYNYYNYSYYKYNNNNQSCCTWYWYWYLSCT